MSHSSDDRRQGRIAWFLCGLFLFATLSRLAYALFGPGELAPRFAPRLLGATTPLLLFLCARWLFGTRTAVAAVLVHLRGGVGLRKGLQLRGTL